MKGSGGDLGTLTEAGPGGAAAGPAARAGRRLPGRRARGRDGRRVRLLPARQGRRGAVDRHRDARPGRRRARRPPAPRLRHRARDRRRRRGADHASASATGWCGCRGGVPASSSGLDIAAIKEANPQAIGCILGGHGITAWGDDQRGVRGELACEIIRTAERVPRRARQGRAVRRRRSPATRRCPRPSAARKAAALAPTIRGLASHRPAAGRALHRLPTSCSTSWRRAKHPRLAALGTSLPGPLPAHQGQAAGARPAGRRAPSRTSIARLRGAARGVPRRLRRLLRPPRRRRTARRCAAPTRRSCWCPASACSPSARTSRPPAWPASSTSTPST